MLSSKRTCSVLGISLGFCPYPCLVFLCCPSPPFVSSPGHSRRRVLHGRKAAQDRALRHRPHHPHRLHRGQRVQRDRIPADRGVRRRACGLHRAPVRGNLLQEDGEKRETRYILLCIHTIPLTHAQRRIGWTMYPEMPRVSLPASCSHGDSTAPYFCPHWLACYVLVSCLLYYLCFSLTYSARRAPFFVHGKGHPRRCPRRRSVRLHPPGCPRVRPAQGRLPCHSARRVQLRLRPRPGEFAGNLPCL